jgi:hypothetical protein
VIVPPGQVGFTCLSWGWLCAICLIRPAARADPDAGGAEAEDVLELDVVDVFVLVAGVVVVWLELPQPANSTQPANRGAAAAGIRHVRRFLRFFVMWPDGSERRRARS